MKVSSSKLLRSCLVDLLQSSSLTSATHSVVLARGNILDAVVRWEDLIGSIFDASELVGTDGSFTLTPSDLVGRVG